MSTQPDPVIQNIIDWCQADNIPCVDSSTRNPQFTWTLTLGKDGNHITIYKQPHLDDRIYFQSQIAWAQEHRTLVNQTWNEGQRSAMMFNLKKSAVLYDCNMTFQLNGDELVGINTNKIHFHSTISKSEFVEQFIRMESIHQILLNQLNIELGIALRENKTNQSTGSTNTGR